MDDFTKGDVVSWQGELWEVEAVASYGLAGVPIGTMATIRQGARYESVDTSQLKAVE